ncbi:fasciclin domain-containing protein [Rhizosaccharibacter radicis]|uniref:Fasciclin domain-containing protein n=1 Tax=Rhizosaccharibacter radicis TaxID=2782605 RepID=A0ABT1VX14_9PROT|nr:fasciclin domain-containing protein [Acetobacteraceae bacterium KSS12]
MRGLLAASSLGLFAPVLAGCESTARQDPFFVRASTDTYVFDRAPLFRDRPLNESILSSLQLADYAAAMRATGVLDELQRPGPYTVFAVPNPPLEAEQTFYRGQLMAPGNLDALRRVLAFTVVPGRYTTGTLRQMIAKQGGPIGLRTLSGDVLGVSTDPRTGELLLSDRRGNQSRLWLSDMPQSNGVLFATQSLLLPGQAPVTPVASRPAPAFR